MKPFFVYLLRCADGSYYAGHTDDLDARMRQHHAGTLGYTSERRPLELAWAGEFETRAGALAFEQQIKGWSRAKKEALIRGDWDAVQRLARGQRWSDAVRPAPVEGQVTDEGLRQAQPERLRDAVRPAPVEGQVTDEGLRQ
ncbi:MAG: GIY-YIG nuclease family protein, partial [Burkholderiales bacterium]|nr:GIY-YIG nuclease family protein [Burkholderiales bacterium]